MKWYLPLEKLWVIIDEFFPLSAKVDFLLFFYGYKPCVRTRLISDLNIKKLEDWCHTFQIQYFLDKEDFIYFSFNEVLLSLAVKLDNSVEKHEQAFGELLGYPHCCCKKIAEVGEHEIDAYEQKLLAQGFDGLFQLISPEKYIDGVAFISHVPCSTSCKNSLDLAEQVVEKLTLGKHFPELQQWRTALERIGFIPLKMRRSLCRSI
ncbi:hypothetical protein [Candidatus Neptunochlamydia vexilliferae]|nr:hypothetical protein [Candidatus Neptunochlamydia vexilliferae]